MRLGAISLFAVIPFSVPETTPPPCAIAIEMQVRAPLGSGTVEWHGMLGEVKRIWAPYGITFCWATDQEPCTGFQVRLRVLVAEHAETRRPDGANVDALGWIGFEGPRPGRQIVVSLGRGRALAAQSRIGFRPAEAWPVRVIENLLPIVLGRALAHEIGHFVLATREHTRTGLMAANYRPQQVALGPRSAFRLAGPDAAAVRRQCGR
jgi:hypothetical protein